MLEYQKIGEALSRWLDDQQIPPDQGVLALASVIGAMMGTKAKHVPDLIEGLSNIHQMVELEAYTVLSNRGKLSLI